MRLQVVCMAVAGGLLLQGCAEMPQGPTVQVLPGRGKSFEMFAQDDALCRGYASSAVQGQAERANTRAIGGAVLGTVLGAGLGAAVGGGRGAGIGAGAGAAVGTGVGASNSGNAQYGIQGQYDNAYVACQASKGNQVPRPAIYAQPAVVVQPAPYVVQPAPYVVQPRPYYAY